MIWEEAAPKGAKGQSAAEAWANASILGLVTIKAVLFH